MAVKYFPNREVKKTTQYTAGPLPFRLLLDIMVLVFDAIVYICVFRLWVCKKTGKKLC